MSATNWSSFMIVSFSIRLIVSLREILFKKSRLTILENLSLVFCPHINVTQIFLFGPT